MTGFGLGFRPPHYKWITETHPNVDWFEIITENFMPGAPRPRKFLEKLRSNYPVATHGVSLSITSLEPLDPFYLKSLKDFVGWLEPEIVSDHLCWTSYENKNSHDLLPTPYTMQNLENVILKVHKLQETLRRQFIFENPSAYVAFSTNEMSEAEFLTELCKKTGCGILLDINNSYVNFKNLGWDPVDYFSKLPISSVKQFHLAGHSVHEGVLIDTHDHPVSSEVWALYRHALTLWPHVPTLVEWDENIPEFNVLMSELNKARDMTPLRTERSSIVDIKMLSKDEIDLKQQYNNFFRNVTSGHNFDKIELKYLRNDTTVPYHRGLEVYASGFILRLESVLKGLFPTLAWITEKDGFHDLILKYVKEFPPRHYSINYAGQDFSKFLSSVNLEIDFGVPSSVLKDIATLEWARVEIFELTSALKLIDLEWDIGPVWASVNRGEDPEKPSPENCTYLIWRKGENIVNTKLSQNKRDFIKALKLEK